jgi:hypothetical protein
MFTSRKKIKEEQQFIELLYNFVLDSNITDRERKIGLMEKKILKKVNIPYK